MLYNPTIVIFVYLLLIVLSFTGFRREEKFILLLVWLLPPLIFMELVMTDPRTHFYTYLIPLLVLCGLGLVKLESLLKRWSNRFGTLIGNGASLILFIFLAVLSQTIFIIHPPEYPWQEKSFLFWQFQPKAFEGMMGFPYSRQWSEIGKFLKNQQGETPGWYISNEKAAIASFYLPETIRFYDTETRKLPEIKPEEKIYAIVVENPQSWLTEFMSMPTNKWKNQHIPIKKIKDKQGAVLAEIYEIDRLELTGVTP